MSDFEKPDQSNNAPLQQARDAPRVRMLSRERLLTRDMLIRVVIAFLLIVVSVFTNRQFLGWGLFAVLGVLIIPYGRARSFIGAFVPYALVWFLFTFLRSLADETIWARTVNTKVVQLERWLFNGELPTIRLQATFYDVGTLHWWDFYFTFIHWSYFLVPHGAAIWLWWRNPAKFRQLLGAITLLLTLGLGLYFLLPTNPPWMAPESVNSPGAPTVLRIMEPIGRQLGGGLYQAGYNVVGESNPIAAMPSIHFAITFLLVCMARDQHRTWRLLVWIYTISMGVALVYLGEHYVVDVVVGGAITAYSWHAAGSWLARLGTKLVARRTAQAAPAPRPGQPVAT